MPDTTSQAPGDLNARADATVDVVVLGAGPAGENVVGFTAARPELGGIDQGTADSLAEAAHEVCPYSNATRGNIPVTVDAVTDAAAA